VSLAGIPTTRVHPIAMTKSLLTFFLSAFVVVALVDPADQIFHLKMPLFLATVIIWMVRVLLGHVPLGDTKLWMGVLLFAGLIPGAASLVGLLGTSLPSGIASFATMKSFLVLLLIPVVVSERMDLAKILVRYSVLVVILTLAMVVANMVSPVLFDAIYAFSIAKENAMINPHDRLGIAMGSFYYKTVAVLMIPLAYHVRNFLGEGKKLVSLVLALVFITAIIFSGSRATVLAAVLVIALLGLTKIRRTQGWRLTAVALVATVALAAALFSAVFNPEEESNAVKLGHLQSYVDEFDRHPSYLLWGQGADTQFYTEGFGMKTTITEVTYLELIRMFGIPVTFVCLLALAYPLTLRARFGDASLAYLGPAYFAYLVESASNPLLIGSTGLLVVVSVWGMVLTMHQGERRILAVGAAT
jgi:hypothetical protein